MECPKCHRIISDNATTCPYCRKVMSLVCPNCHTLSKSSVCEKCGYIILEKCSKCGQLTPTTHENCKCGLSVKTSIACNECESDEFASVTVKFGALRAIRNLLASQDLYAKFLVKLKNLIHSQLKGVEGNIIIYGDTYVINLNKELSFATSVDKAVRLSLKILNAFSGLNMRLQDELGTPLKINIAIVQKKAEELLLNKSLENNVKPLMLKKSENRYLRGMQVVLDQFAQDSLSEDYKTDSLYMLEQDGNSIMFYELMIENYVLPPSADDETPLMAEKRDLPTGDKNDTSDIYNFKVLDINAQCKFEKCYSDELLSKLSLDKKIIALRGEKELQIKTSDLVDYYRANKYVTVYVSCSDELNYKPWGFFEKVFKDYFSLSTASGLINPETDCRQFNGIKDLLSGNVIKASTSEDARFAYMEMFCNFLSSLRNCVIIVDGFENIDDTSLQTLELYFDKFKRVNATFVFITDTETPVHSKIKGLLRTPLYTEYTMVKNGVATLLSNIKEDAADFVKSFYYEKIKENFNGSKLYFEHALKYLIDKNVLISFEDKLIIKNNNSVMLPKNLAALIKTRLKFFGKNQDASMILAYSVFLGERIDFEMLEKLGIKNIQNNAKILQQSGFVFVKDSVIYINNYTCVRTYIKSSLKKEVEEFLAKNIIAKLGKVIGHSLLSNLMGVISQFKEQYLLLWQNSQLAISSGDYDAYLKNCLGFLSIINKINEDIPQEAIEENKKDVFQNILMSLYNYSPAKIYSIENILLMDAMNANDDGKIVKLSNLMLQGALLSSNYTDALSLLHNILERMENPYLIVDGAINTKFLLLSLVNIEILFNIGDYDSCIDLGDKLISVITPDVIEKIKPASFSANSFITHLLDTFRLVGFAKLITLSDLDEFFEKIKTAFGEDLPEKDSIVALKDFLSGKNYTPSNVEEASPVSKVIYLILNELSNLKTDYKTFAQNIYQAKLLAADIYQKQLEYICDLLIAYAYFKIGIISKSSYICNDVLEKSEKSAVYNTIALSNYLLAKSKIDSGEVEEGLLIINDLLDSIQKRDNQAIVFYALFEKLYIDTMINNNIQPFDLESEQQKLLAISENGDLERIIRSSEFAVKPLEFIQEEAENDLAEFTEDEDSMGTEVHE